MKSKSYLKYVLSGIALFALVQAEANAFRPAHSQSENSAEEERRNDGVREAKKEVYAPSKVRKTSVLKDKDEALIQAKDLCKEQTDESSLLSLVSNHGLDSRLYNFFWNRPRKTFWRNAEEGVFPADLITRTRKHRETIAKCKSVSFKAHYGVISGDMDWNNRSSSELLRQGEGATEATGNPLFIFYALTGAIIGETSLKSGEHRGFVRTEAICEPRSEQEREAIERVESCFVEAEDLFRDAGLIDKDEDLAAFSQAVRAAQDKEDDCVELAERQRDLYKLKETVITLPEENVDLCVELDEQGERAANN